MRTNRLLTVFVAVLFSAAFVAADLCRCADALAGHSAAEIAQPSGSHNCEEGTQPQSPCPSHAFHALSGNGSSIAPETARITSAPLPPAGSATVVTTSAAPSRSSPFRVQPNPLRAARSIPILNATFLL